MIVAVAVLVAVAVAVAVARPWEQSPPTMASAQRPKEIRSVSVDLGIVIDPDTDWKALDAHLDDAGANAVDLSAGRVEFTGFDWDAHPEAAAEPGTDHLARAARALREDADGRQRQIGLIVDAYVPRWIERDPSVAGTSVDGHASTHSASASQLARGVVGDRLVEYVTELGERYAPSQIAITELFLDVYSFGEEDLALYREMTGHQDWPRTSDGQIDQQAPLLGSWRSEVVADLLGRMRTALDQVRGGQGTRIALAMDVRVNWDDPAPGDPLSGHGYEALLGAADRLVVWAYLFTVRSPAEIERLTSTLATAGYDMSQLEISVGLWAPGHVDPTDRISTQTLVEAVQDAQTNGITDVNVTPLSLMTDEDWTALGALWRHVTG